MDPSTVESQNFDFDDYLSSEPQKYVTNNPQKFPPLPQISSY